MAERIMSCLAKETGGTSYKAFKYGLDHADKPTVDYDENGIIWKAYGETQHLTKYRSLMVIFEFLYFFW